MSCKVMYTCDHCGKEVSPYINRQWKAGFLTVGPSIDDIHACSKEHLTLALAKTFDIPLDASTLRLVTEKNDALTAPRAAIIERDNMRARLAELEARMPANEVTNAERMQYETTIELQQKRIEELETLEAVSIERLARIEEPAQRLVAIDNELAEGRDAAAKASFHDSVMRPIEELRVYFGNIARTEKRGQTLFDREVERRKRAESGRDELHDRVAELEKRIAKLTAPVTVDGKTPQDTVDALRRVRERIDSDPYPDVRSLRHIDEELAKLEAKPAQCPPDTSTESGLPDAVLAAITLPTKPTKPLRERLEELAAYWYRGDKDDKELNGAYRLARRECAKELREVINDPR